MRTNILRLDASFHIDHFHSRLTTHYADRTPAIRRQMIARLAHNQRRQQTGASNAFFDGLQRNGCRGDSALTAGAGILFQMMVMNLELPRYKLQHATDLFADAGLVALANTADLFFRRHIVIMFHLRQCIKTQLAVSSLLLTPGRLLLSGCDLCGVFGTAKDFIVGGRLFCGRLRLGKQRTHLKQMLLLRIRNVPFPPRTVHPAAKQSQFVERLLMLFAKLIEILCCAIQNLFEITVSPLLFRVLLLIFARSPFHPDEQILLLCHQSMALRKVAGKGK